MAVIELKAEPRKVFGKKVKTLRQEGYVPAEIYGRASDNISIQVPAKELGKVLNEAGTTGLISIKVGRKKGVATLARNLQYSPIKQELLHVDFYAVVMTDTVQVTVPVHLIGESPLTKEGGRLLSGLNELDIEALPADLPEAIEVDISKITEFNHVITVADLDLGENITIHSSLESMLATIQPPRLEEVEEEAAEEGELESEIDSEAESDEE